MENNMTDGTVARRNDNPIRLSFERPQFKTEGNTVTCELRYSIVNEPRVIYNGENNELTSFVGVGMQRAFRHPMNVATGSAVCSETDNFNKVTGRRIAQARAEAAAYLDARNVMRQHFKNLHKSILEAEAFMNKADGVIAHNKEFVKKIGNPV